MMKRATILSVFFLGMNQLANSQENVSYSFTDDASWAIQSQTLSAVLGADKQVLYDKYIQDCQTAAVSQYNKPGMNCRREEKYRLDMNKFQPQSVRNYTQAGYTKIRAPPGLFALIQSFYNENKGRDEIEWAGINTYHNMWDVPPTIVHINQQKNKGGGPQLQNQIWRIAKEIMEEWTGQELSPVSLYGIRIYHNGSILAPQYVQSAYIQID
jgi:hypothetical protein